MTKDELFALLREALKKLEAADLWHPPGECRCIGCNIARPIDAALAAHDAVPPSEEKVESEVVWRNTPDGEDAVVNNVVLSVWGWRAGWAWQSKPLAEPSYLNRTEMGLSKTLDEAKSAAIAAARGMR